MYSARKLLEMFFLLYCVISCIAHIVNLAADVFQKYEHFHHTGTLIIFIRNMEERLVFKSFLSDTIAAANVKLPPVPVSTRWNSCFEAALIEFIHVEGFIRQKKVDHTQFYENRLVRFMEALV